MANYTAIDAQTVAQIVAQSPTYAKQIIWMADIHFDRERYNPFTDLMGGVDSVRPIKEVMDTQKVRGNTIVVSSEAGLGGKGVQGATQMIGTEEKRKYSQYTLTIGHHRHAVGETVLSKDQTFIGKTFDTSARRGLKEWVQRLKCDCIEATMIGEATSRNTLYSGNKSSIDTLTSVDTLSTATIGQAKIQAQGLGMKEIAIAKDKGNQRIEKYYLQGNVFLLKGLRDNSIWQSLLATAGDRGPNNYLFGGHLPEYDGVLLNNWSISSTSADAAQGAFCAPRAYLGTAYVAKATSSTLVALTGGGYNNDATLTTNAVAKTGNDYFRYFGGAPFSAFEKTFIAATTTDRFLAIQHISGADSGKMSLFKYTTTDGYTISATGMERLGSTVTGGYVTTLTGSSITWGTAPWTTAYLSEGLIPSGSLIIPINAKGQAFVAGYMMGNEAIITGYGTIDGKSSTAFGQRVVEIQDYENNYGIGIRMVWGCKAIENAAKIVAGYIVIYGSYNPPGFPEIS